MTIAFRFPPLSAFPASNDRGESQEARRLAQSWAQVADAQYQTARAGQALANLDAAAEEALVRNWDGYGAEVISIASYRQARRLLQMLPSAVPTPDIGVTPRGDVTIEWHAGRNWAFSIALGPGNTATYAGIFGAGRVHGREVFSDEIPLALLSALNRFLSAVARR